MLAERFREAGYRTGGFAGDAYVDSKFGFDQGFDRYEDLHEDTETGPAPIAEAALRWIRSQRRRPIFAFVHTYEPHSPYTEGDFADPADAEGLPPIFDSPLIQKIHDGELVLSENQRRWVRDLSAGDVARTDRILGGMIEALREDGILDRTILVVLSDHGEDFWTTTTAAARVTGTRSTKSCSTCRSSSAWPEPRAARAPAAESRSPERTRRRRRHRVRQRVRAVR